MEVCDEGQHEYRDDLGQDADFLDNGDDNSESDNEYDEPNHEWTQSNTFVDRMNVQVDSLRSERLTQALLEVRKLKRQSLSNGTCFTLSCVSQIT